MIYAKDVVRMGSSTIKSHAVAVWIVGHQLTCLYFFLITILAGEICDQWHTWSEYLNVQSILGQSLLQALLYIALSVRVPLFQMDA